ncbi:helix-turn-helix domain-containing protein [Rhodobacteraceae bacterium 2CG4]|uniref:Helix-turn-helix domain-containing protein n=1 Tax=Halovulum marinum TaxID=2662447 RepID=A0A6L5Z0T6_9RHOB|nr:helix-turn-helix domain-containing protein [Halovulum marinum]MSU90151.1 helix-turn-helix domain-containing protein [Halovulum marinum]
MESTQYSEALTALGHEGRLAVFRLLARRAPHGVRPSEIGTVLRLKPNTLSVYLSTLERAGLVRSHRRGRAVFYAIDLGRTGALVDFLVADCCNGRPDLCAPRTARALSTDMQGGFGMSDRPFNVLFLCSGNSARSIFAEALLRDLGAGRFSAFSAGIAPAAAPNRFALEILGQLDHDTSQLRAKSIDEFQRDGAPVFDFVFTVCDTAANELCPPWPGQPMTAHWGLPDPVRAEGTDAEKALAFKDTYRQLRQRISAFVSIPFEGLSRESLQRQLDATDRATETA